MPAIRALWPVGMEVRLIGAQDTYENEAYPDVRWSAVALPVAAFTGPELGMGCSVGIKGTDGGEEEVPGGTLGGAFRSGMGMGG